MAIQVNGRSGPNGLKASVLDDCLATGEAAVGLSLHPWAARGGEIHIVHAARWLTAGRWQPLPKR